MLAQLTPYSCALDSFSYFLRSTGLNVYSSDILTNHRDLCWNNPPNHSTYGAIDLPRFRELIKRYLFKSNITENLTPKEVKTILDKKQNIFVFSENYDDKGTAHVYELIGLDEANEAKIFVPVLPYGCSTTANFGNLTNLWKSTFIKVYF